MLYRSNIEHLLKWHASSRRKPLVLRGARQVGKSTLVKALAEALDLPLYTINCEKHIYLDELFKTLNVKNILSELEVLADQGPMSPEGIIFLDEVQMTPHALQALRYFYEERPELSIISAGSLLEFILSDHSFPMPVGRIQYHHLGPMTFSEFANALEPKLLPYITQLSFDESLPRSAHQKLLDLQRLYLFIGGMPEAVQAYKLTQSLEEASAVHREILDTYLDDFSKYAQQRDLVLLQNIFSSIPRLIGKKIKYVALARGERSATVRAMIDLLAKAQVILPIWHSHCSGLPLGADIDDSVFKLCFLDVGLAGSLLGTTWQDISRCDDVSLVNEGGVAEQFVAQELAWSHQDKPELTYWQREGKANNAEVDFVKGFHGKIYPIEVKAGKSGSMRSLHQFILQKKSPRAIRLDTNPASRQNIQLKTKNGDDFSEISFELLSLPIYGVGELNRLLAPS